MTQGFELNSKPLPPPDLWAFIFIIDKNVANFLNLLSTKNEPMPIKLHKFYVESSECIFEKYIITKMRLIEGSLRVMSKTEWK